MKGKRPIHHRLSPAIIPSMSAAAPRKDPRQVRATLSKCCRGRVRVRFGRRGYCLDVGEAFSLSNALMRRALEVQILTAHASITARGRRR